MGPGINDTKQMIGMGTMMPFEEKVLCSGLCDFTLPASFIREGQDKWVLYDSSGYTCLADLDLGTADFVFEVLEKTIANMRKAVEFLIDPAKITLSERTVFFDLKKRDVKFAYFPDEDGSLAGSVGGLMMYLAERAPGNAAAALRSMEREMKVRNMSLRDMAGYASLVRRDLKSGRGHIAG